MSPERMSFIESAISKVRAIEQNPKPYERIGIRTYKKYTVPFGDLAHKYVWNRLGIHPANLNDRTLKSLKVMRFGTYAYEGAHLAPAIYTTKQTADAMSGGNFEIAVGLTFVNIIVNIYPMLVQHYNRGRLSHAIDRRNRVSDFDVVAHNRIINSRKTQ